MQKRIAIFSISSNNYMPYSRAFIDSSNVFHQNADHFLCLVDHVTYLADYYPDTCRLVSANCLDIPDFAAFAFRYDVMELNTAVKPFMFLHLFRMGYDQVLYFDPDIKIYQPVTPIFDALDAGASVVLTPHLTQPAETNTPPDDVTIMNAGIYNLGFVAFGRQDGVEAVLRWWARRLRYQCINAQTQGLFVDQKFVDLIPGFLPDVAILRDTALNVAYWNLFQRRLDYAGDGWKVDGKPLVFFHFSGYDPRNSRQLSKYTTMFAGDNSPALNDLLDDYRTGLLARDLEHTPRGNYQYDRFNRGARIPTFVRHYFRDTYPTWDGDPFEIFENHLHRQALGTAFTGNGAVCTNLMLSRREIDPHLRATFDLAEAGGVTRYTDWFIRHGHAAGVDPRLIHPVVDRIADFRRRRVQHVASPDADDTVDISVFGHLTAEGQSAEAGRLTLSALAAGERPVEGLDIVLAPGSWHEDRSSEVERGEPARGRVHILATDVDQLPLAQDRIGGSLRRNAYRIAVPQWDLAALPEELVAAFDGIDEIWAPSRFIQSALITKLRKPVLRMPLVIDVAEPRRFARDHFGLPEGRFLFLFLCDGQWCNSRTNPAAVVDAFRFAFAGRDLRGDVSLIIKRSPAGAASIDRQSLRGDVSDLDIHIIDHDLGRVDMLGLMALADCVVSLHRSEGLNLSSAMAMALGIPVIATDYSAPSELISPETGYPVDYQLVPLAAGDDHPFGEDQLWADPDLTHAAWQMRQVVEQSGRNAGLIAAARQRVDAEHGLDAVRSRQAARLTELGV